MTIWPQVAATMVTGLMAGSLAVPAAKSLVLGSPKRDWLADELTLDRIEPDGQTVRGKDGSLSRVYHLRGTNYDARVEAEQWQFMLNRSALLHQLGKKKLQVRLFGVKRQRDLSYEATWPNPILKKIGDKESSLYKFSYYVDWYLVVTGRAMHPLIEAHAQVDAMTGPYGCTPVTRPEKPTDPCPLTGFLNGLISGEFRRDLPTISQSLSGSLPGSDFRAEKETGVIATAVPDEQFHKVISVWAWPEAVSGLLTAEIMAVPGDIELSQISEPWDNDQAMLLYSRRQTGASMSWIGNPAMADDCQMLLNLLSEGNTSLFATQYQIIPRATSREALTDLVAKICTILADKRVPYRIETIGAPSCWFARLPNLSGKIKLVPGNRLLHPLNLRDQNIAALWAFHNASTGLFRSPYGAYPVRYFATRSGQAYAFQFHVSDKPKSRGSFLLFAPTGGGKSTLVMHLLAGLAKFPGIRSYIFDSKEGNRFMVEAMGGVYQGYDDLALNPLDVGDDSTGNRHLVHAILRSMVVTSDLDEEDEASLSHAVDLIFQMDTPDRTLSTVFDYAFPRRSKIRRAFSEWVVDEKGNKGLLSHIFNAPHDALGGFLNQSHMVGINMNEALDDPKIGSPIVAHISAAISRAAHGSAKGFTIFIDEAAKLLQNDGFRLLAMEMFREYRKLNGSVGLAFQDPGALLKSGAPEAFIENAATLIFLPNSLATKESLEPFNLNDEQKAFILSGAQKGRREALVVKRDAASGYDESAIIDVDLSPYGPDILDDIYRNGPEANAHLAELKNTWGAEWVNHL
jgi:type IV secretion system protein VirB4